MSDYESAETVTSETSLDRLDSIIEDFADPDDHRVLRFAHLVVPIPVRTTYVIEEQIIEAIGKVDSYNVIFIMPNVEQAVAGLANLDLPRLPIYNQKTLRHGWFVSILEDNRIAGHDLFVWKESNTLYGWGDELTLPKRAFVVFYLDPYMSAECALALLGLVDWARDISQMQGTKIRVLTVSSYFGNSLLTDLAQSDYPVAHYELPIPDADILPDGSVDYADGNDILDRIHDHERTGGENERHAMIFVPPFARKNMFMDWDVELKWAELLIKNRLDGGQMVTQLTYPMSMGMNPRGVIINVDLDHQIPGFLIDFTHAHIVIGKRCVRRVLDEHTGLIVTTSVALTQSEINTLKWWCWQPEMDAGNIHVYPGSDGFRASEGAAVYCGSQIENAQAGGFIMALLLSKVDIDIDLALSSLIKAPWVVQAMVKRLQRQRIIVNDATDDILELGLTVRQEVVFTAVLHLVSYDYRLAHLVALESSDPQIRRLKVQLAIFLMLKNDWEITYPRDTSIVLRSWGWGQPSNGDLWTIFGMWKRIAKDCRDFEGLDDRPVYDMTHSISLPNRAALFFKNATIIFERVLNSIPGDFDVGLPPHRISDEYERLTDGQMAEISRHLLSAYLDELVLTRIVTSDGDEPRLVHTIFSKGISVELKA
ncbi:hypothetical protein F53441_10099 [Fusarium austroafricanum]|uniref:Uncharacterized protein n=1 Tax=Fusarium austroafricanum TaxID=2364996 RepID=A0A8H4KC27_9HYPO|nr:hypothetical protein F53441_10099 [Fusarium austroafricanum]